MADYQPLIAKAVAGLEKNTGEARRALYERARTALVAQLRGVTPALSESDITRERLALEEAIRKVEAESARKARYEPPMRTDPRASARTAREVPPSPPQPHVPREAPADERRPDAPAEPDVKARPEGRPDVGATGTAAELRRHRGRPPGDRPTLSDEGIKGFRDVVAEVESLGEATAQAGKTAREAYAQVPPPGAASERLEPHMEPEGLRPRARRPTQPESARGYEATQPGDAARGREAPDPARMRPRSPADADHVRAAPVRDRRADTEIDVRPGPAEYFEDALEPYPDQGPADEAAAAELRPSRRALGRPPGEAEPAQRLRTWPLWLKTTIIASIALVLLGVVVWQRQPILGMVSGLTSMFASKPTTTAPHDATPSRPKIADRVGDNVQRDSQSGPIAAVAQRVVLYEEEPSDPAGKQYVGSAVWRTELVAPAPGQPPEMAVRADIEIPDRKITMRWSLRRNTDASLPASHTIEIMFNLPPDFSHGGIQNIPGILMKQAEQTRGVPLAGLAVKVTTNFFLIGLSSVDTDMQRNVALLKERAWFDVPVVYNDGRRAILAVEKGNPGDRAFQDAFAAWAAKGK
jgi:hypothetical protein